tara:strand:+ start:589 stop:936 length:348 start_codon:yes stop_codon:yes gene_type:complete
MRNTSVPLSQLAKIIRSKNAGPFRLTFDVIFDNSQSYELVRDSKALNKIAIGKAFSVDETQIASIFAVNSARAIKITMFRPVDQGSVGETDSYGCQQHVPLLDIKIPTPMKTDYE